MSKNIKALGVRLSFCFILKPKITLFHLLSFTVTRFLIRCFNHCATRPHSFYHSSFVVPLVVICCHFLSFIFTRSTTRCHLLSLVVPLVATYFYSMYYSSVLSDRTLHGLIEIWIIRLNTLRRFLKNSSISMKVTLN